MGHGHAYRPPIAHLNLTDHSLSKNLILCPEWNLSFELHKNGDIVTVVRRDPYYPQPFVVAEWERHTFHKDKLRVLNPAGYDSGNLPVDSIFPKTSGFFSGSE